MNEGKKFEQDIKKSIPDDAYYKRMPDASIGFDIANSPQRFAPKSPFDCLVYKSPHLHIWELKSTNSGRVSFAGSSPMIKKHQIEELTKAAQYDIKSGFLINFRDTGGTYFVPISSFEAFRIMTEKKSVNEKDMDQIGIEIPHRKLKVNYRYDLNILLDSR